MNLLKELCAIHAPSSEEYRVRDFIIEFVRKHSTTWEQTPELFYGDGYQDCLILKFGNPTHAIMAHMDSNGFMAAYSNELTTIGSPAPNEGGVIRNERNETRNIYYDNQLKEWQLKDDCNIESGSTWTWNPFFSQKTEYVESPFLDNRLSIYVLLKIASQLSNVALAFSTYEEMTHGGTSDMLAKIMFEKWQVDKILIADITWVTPFVRAGEGVVLSYRDVGVPRRKFRGEIEALMRSTNIPYQIEIEKSGGSDGTVISSSVYPIDWIFIGAPEINPHGNIEKVHKSDIDSMMKMYTKLNELLH